MLGDELRLVGDPTTGAVPVHEEMREVGERIAQRRHLPVEHRRDLGTSGSSTAIEHVAEAVVAVHQRGVGVGRAPRGQRGADRLDEWVVAVVAGRATARASGRCAAPRSPSGRPSSPSPTAAESTPWSRSSTSTIASEIARAWARVSAATSVGRGTPPPARAHHVEGRADDPLVVRSSRTRSGSGRSVPLERGEHPVLAAMSWAPAATRPIGRRRTTYSWAPERTR